MGLNKGRADVGLRARPSRRGSVVVYGILTMVVFLGFCSLAVDYGRAQMVKTELRRTADATAHDYLTLYQLYGQSYADANGPQSYSSGNNPVSSGTSAPPTVSVQWGYWDATHRSFSTT